MDYEDMDKKIKAHNIHVAVFCNPHNPCGRVWERQELEKALEVYKANDCVVTMYAPSKTFNLAGLIGSYHVIYNKYLRDRVRSKGSKPHYNSMNVLSMHALIGAYKPEGHEWVDELCEVISGNVNYGYDYIKEHFKGVEVSKPQGTYMLLLDCEEWYKVHGKTILELEKMCWDVGVACQDGQMFHVPYGLRVNLALPFERVKEAFDRLDKCVFNAE